MALDIGVLTSGNAPGEGFLTWYPHYFPIQPGGGGVGDTIDNEYGMHSVWQWHEIEIIQTTCIVASWQQMEDI